MSREYRKYLTDPRYLRLLYKSMVDIHNLFIRNNILYYASGGTLIGAIRHKGIIGHDNDIDLCISNRDVKFLMSREFKKQLGVLGYRIKYHRESEEESYDWLKIFSSRKVNGKKADIDLFPVDLREDQTGKYRTYFSSNYTSKIWTREYAYINELFPLKQVSFGKGIILVPNKSKRIMDRAVGKGWLTSIVITQTPEHEDLDEPIIIKSRNFKAGGLLASARRQIKLDKNSPLLTGLGYGLMN